MWLYQGSNWRWAVDSRKAWEDISSLAGDLLAREQTVYLCISSKYVKTGKYSIFPSWSTR